jgi:hypothetical protein
LERLELAEVLLDLVGLDTVEGLATQDFSAGVHDAEGDNLLVEVGADEVHERSPGLGAGDWEKLLKSSPSSEVSQTAASTSSPLIVSPAVMTGIETQ